MYHKIIIVGNLGRNPEMRFLPDGRPVTNFSVATSRKWTGGDGETHEETIWWRITAWGRLAEVCNQYLSKGRRVLVEGQMRPDPNTGGPRVYSRNDGTPGASYEVTAATVKFLGGRSQASNNEASSGGEPVVASDDDIIF